MILSKYLLGIVILIFIILCLSFYTIESFIQSSATRVIDLEDRLPIVRIEIIYNGPPNKDNFLHLADLEIIDNEGKLVKYWDPPNSVHFEEADKEIKEKPCDLKIKAKTCDIQSLYDGDINTFAHSSTVPDKLIILLNPHGMNINSIQITNRKDCGEERIKQYEMHLYSKVQMSGAVPLTELGKKGKSITYVLIQPVISTKCVS